MTCSTRTRCPKAWRPKSFFSDACVSAINAGPSILLLLHASMKPSGNFLLLSSHSRRKRHTRRVVADAEYGSKKEGA